MRKLLFLSMVVVVAVSATGCNCARNRGMFGHQQSASVMCCPQVQCCDPCSMSGSSMGGGAMMGSPMVSDGASCCN